MLGEKIGEETSKTTGRRVLNVEGHPVVETSAQGTGTIFGNPYKVLATYNGKLQPDGTLDGHGIGVLMGNNGEHATWTGNGLGRFNASGGVSWRGQFVFRTTHPKWTRLNGCVAAFEYEIDGEGNGKGQFTEWK